MFKQALALKENLKKGHVTFGTWITLAHPGIAEILCKCSFDWLVIDMEHSAIGISEAQQIIQVISLSGKVPLIRLSDQNPTLIKRVMDAGAAGVLVPNVRTVSEAKTVIAAVKYPPYGNRGVGLARAQGYGLDFETYKEWVNKGSIVILQIEHYEGVKNLKEILKLEGIDGIIIGPYDLSGSIGKVGKLNDSEVCKLVQDVIDTASNKKIALGYHVVQPDINEVKLRIKQGFNFLGYSLDTIVIGKTFSEHLKEIRKQSRRIN